MNTYYLEVERRSGRRRRWVCVWTGAEYSEAMRLLRVYTDGGALARLVVQPGLGL